MSPHPLIGVAARAWQEDIILTGLDERFFLFSECTSSVAWMIRTIRLNTASHAEFQCAARSLILSPSCTTTTLFVGTLQQEACLREKRLDIGLTFA